MGRISRRAFNRMAVATGALALAPLAGAQVRFGSLPFQLGVASGDPSADGFVIWTRLAPEPFDPSTLGETIFEVAWEVAEDAGFERIAQDANANFIDSTAAPADGQVSARPAGLS